MATKTRLTLEEFLELPETKPASEFVCGEVIQKPMPNQGHGFIQGFMFMVLFQFLAKAGLGRTGPEIRCVFGPPEHRRAFVPDLVVLAKELLPTTDAAVLDSHYGPPMVAVEVLSPKHHADEFADKIQFYLQHGVRLVWVINPMTRVITVLAPGRDSNRLTAGDTLDGGDVLPGFSIAVDDIFAQLQV